MSAERPVPRRLRVGGSWGAKALVKGGMVTLVLEGNGVVDSHGRRPDDELVGMVRDLELATRIARAYNAEIERDRT